MTKMSLFARLHRPAVRKRKAAKCCERPWLCEEQIQRVAAMPDPLPGWAEKIWVDFVHHVQEEQNAFKLSSDSKGIVGDVEAQPLAVRACSGSG